MQFTERNSGVFAIPREEVRRFETSFFSSRGMTRNLAKLLFRAFSNISVNIHVEPSHEVYTVRYVSDENALARVAA